MSFPTYPEYQESGVEWLGEVPKHWYCTKLSFLCFKVGSGKTPKGGSETYVDKGVLFIRSQNVYDDGLRLDDVVYISDEVDEEMAISRVEHGDVLLNITGASLGRTCLVLENTPAANVNQHVCIIRLRDAEQREFIAMSMKAFLVKSQIDACQNGAAREGLNFEQIGQLRITIPPLEEQRTIATFLDHETSKIDALVAEQRRLIGLLQEKRQAVISHAVTKGLDPTVKLKHSGIEWLGEVPEHWEVKPLKYLAKFRSGGTPSKTVPSYWNGDVPWASSKDLKTELLADTIDHITEHAVDSDAATLVPAGTVLVVVRGMILLHTFPVVQTLVPMAINQDLKALIPTESIALPYLPWLLRGSTDATFGRIDEAAHGTKVLRMEAWTSIQLPVPPIDEQIEIVDAIEKQSDTFLELRTQAERAIELLQERRTALISAAVTGKIDVRQATTDTFEHEEDCDGR